ncbi:MAG: glutathione synthase, partial [Alphaproteobacteria bacterium]
MTLDIAVQMDPIETFDLPGDSTFALMLEATRRGYSLFTYPVFSLALENGKLGARGQAVAVHDGPPEGFIIGEEREVELADFDVVLMRQDPPFDMGYITATHLLDHIHPKTLVVNDPAHVRNAPEKTFVTQFPEFMPATLITRDVERAREFRQAHGDIIVKPLYGNGGAGVFRLTRDDENFSALLELFESLGPEPYIVQEYRAEIRAGDKRIILVDGQVAGAINRVPQAGEARSNMHVGGQAEPAELTTREHEICEALGPVLKERGLVFVHTSPAT